MAQGVRAAAMTLQQLAGDEGDKTGHDSDRNHGGERCRCDRRERGIFPRQVGQRGEDRG
jgi:hypothetical protein